HLLQRADRLGFTGDRHRSRTLTGWVELTPLGGCTTGREGGGRARRGTRGRGVRGASGRRQGADGTLRVDDRSLHGNEDRDAVDGGRTRLHRASLLLLGDRRRWAGQSERRSRRVRRLVRKRSLGAAYEPTGWRDTGRDRPTTRR